MGNFCSISANNKCSSPTKIVQHNNTDINRTQIIDSLQQKFVCTLTVKNIHGVHYHSSIKQIDRGGEFYYNVGFANTVGYTVQLKDYHNLWSRVVYKDNNVTILAAPCRLHKDAQKFVNTIYYVAIAPDNLFEKVVESFYVSTQSWLKSRSMSITSLKSCYYQKISANAYKTKTNADNAITIIGNEAEYFHKLLSNKTEKELLHYSDDNKYYKIVYSDVYGTILQEPVCLGDISKLDNDATQSLTYFVVSCYHDKRGIQKCINKWCSSNHLILLRKCYFKQIEATATNIVSKEKCKPILSKSQYFHNLIFKKLVGEKLLAQDESEELYYKIVYSNTHGTIFTDPLNSSEYENLNGDNQQPRKYTVVSCSPDKHNIQKCINKWLSNLKSYSR